MIGFAIWVFLLALALHYVSWWFWRDEPTFFSCLITAAASLVLFGVLSLKLLSDPRGLMFAGSYITLTLAVVLTVCVMLCARLVLRSKNSNQRPEWAASFGMAAASSVPLTVVPTAFEFLTTPEAV